VSLALVIIALAVVGAPVPAWADRVAYVARALAAVHELGPAARDKLDRDMYDAARTRCHADTVAPTVTCLVDAATAICAGNGVCEAAADVVAANLLARNDWVDEPTRFRLVRESTDYHAALAIELHRRYAALAAELALGGTGDAAAIDRLCAQRDRTVHACRDGDPACVSSIPWSRCVGALVWFVGASQ
jgi:hypothetical protein